MLTILANVCYVLVAFAMIVLILLQRGAGAAAGSGFGGGASSTVFGARGSANFMSRSTAVLAGLFFMLSLGMAIFHAKPGMQQVSQDLGIMGAAVPAATPAAADVPQASATAPVDNAPVDATVPAAEPAVEAPAPATPEPGEEPKKKD